MDKVGRLVGKRNEIGQVEWHRVVSVGPVKYGAILAITRDETSPARYPAVDWSIVCSQCDGAGHLPEGIVCPTCGGNGRKKLIPMQKPHMEPPKPFRGWAELMPRPR